MNQNKPENHDAMSTGELLGRLKKNFPEESNSANLPVNGKAEQPQAEDDLDIAALLKQYLPNNAAPAQTEEAPAPEKSVAEPVPNEAKTGTHFASLLDSLRLEGDQAEPAFETLDELPESPLGDFAPEAESAPVQPVAGVRKYVYHFRPSARNAVQTVKVHETVPQEPISAAPAAEPSDYFSGRAKPEFDFDDEPVIPDASAFDELIGSLTEITEKDAQPAAEEAVEAPAAETVAEEPKVETVTEAEPEPNAEPAVDLDETDINLMIALGYEEELSKTVGIDKVSEIEKQLNSEVDGEDTSESAAFRGFEYTEKAQAKEIMQSYKSEYSGILLRLFGTLVLLVALFLYENASLFGVSLPGALNIAHYPAVHTLVSLQLLVLAGALSWRQLFDGLKGAVTLKPTPQSLASVAVAVAVIYDLLIALIAPTDPFALYNFPAALCLFLLVLCDLMNLKREIYSFTVVADRRDKYAVRTKFEPTAAPDEEALLLDIRRTSFVENYFARTNRRAFANTRLNYVLLPVVALAIALAIVSFSTSKSSLDALHIFVLTVLFCMPVSTLIACSNPIFRASQIAFEQDTAIIGETSAEEYSGAEIVSFTDKDIFPAYSVKLRSIKLYGNARPDLVLFAAASVFSKVGGPLDDVLELATKEFDRAEQITVKAITDTGIEAEVDGVAVLVGRSEFLEAYNIYPMHDAEDDANLNSGARILYIVMDGVLSAKLYIQYDMDVDFEFTLRELAREHITARIRTYDPNIDDALIASKLRGRHYDIVVERQYTEPTEPDPIPVLDSGLVSRASAKSLVHTATVCSRLTHVEHTGSIIRAISLAVSLLIMLFLTLLSSSVGISSVYVALYQIFWMIPALIITRLFVK